MLRYTTPSKKRIIFFGTPEFAAYILAYLVKNNENIVAAVTPPPKLQGRGLHSMPFAVDKKARELGIPVLSPIDLRDTSFIEALRSLNADIFCIVAYRILPPEVYTLPTLGAFNVHTSLLPKYRGAAPMQRALMNGEHVTGVTTFLLTDKVDTGNILLQERTLISEDETVGELHDDLMERGARLALDTIRGLAIGELKPQKQDDRLATSAPKILPEDRIIDFSDTAENIHNKVRALSPYPAAFCILPNDERLKIFRTRRAVEMTPLPQGQWKIMDNSTRIIVGTKTEPIEIIELQREGKKRMLASEFLRGSRSLFETVTTS
jgi:methionyl-tRNA formyltransferase